MHNCPNLTGSLAAEKAPSKSHIPIQLGHCLQPVIVNLMQFCFADSTIIQEPVYELNLEKAPMIFLLSWVHTGVRQPHWQLAEGGL